MDRGKAFQEVFESSMYSHVSIHSEELAEYFFNAALDLMEKEIERLKAQKWVSVEELPKELDEDTLVVLRGRHGEQCVVSFDPKCFGTITKWREYYTRNLIEPEYYSSFYIVPAPQKRG